jgi:O-methyltransferase
MTHLLEQLKKMIKKPKSLASESRFYKDYKSFANPVYHPDLDESECSRVIAKVAQDIPTETYHEPYARSILYNLAKHSLHVPGDFIECGVHHGGGSHVIAFVLDQYDPKRTLWCFDSFQGFSEPCSKDIDIRTNSSFFKQFDLNNTSADQVREVLQHHQCPIQVIAGWIPHTWTPIENNMFCFVHIDVDLYEPITECLHFLYPRTTPGGVILLDDYGFPMLLGAKKAVDDFFRDKKEVVIPLPTGQAIVHKL